MKLGVVGSVSGVAAPLGVPMTEGIQIWGRWINSRGGVNGHPIQIFVGDDGADPARHQAVVKDMVERIKVLAFINNPEVFTGAASVKYLESKRIPVIGMSGGETWAYQSPMYFPQVPAGPRLTLSIFSSIAQQSRVLGKSKIAVITCVEAQLCKDFANQADTIFPQRGMTVVYKAQISITQPDFTAECLGARNAGAEVIFLAAEANSLRRASTSCARQSYKPRWASANQALVHDIKDEPNLEGLLSQSAAFPYYQGNTPQTAEYQNALKQYGPNTAPAGALSFAWVSGKLFEKAAANLGEPPTTEGILDGLWTIRNDDMNGLTAPLTFNRDQPPPVPPNCWWNVLVTGRQWTSPDNFERHCD